MGRALLIGLCALVLAAPANAFTKQDVRIPMDDGVSLAATLWLPARAAPAAGWPAIVVLHGLSGDRGDLAGLVESYFASGDEYAVLAYDARGHGESGGVVGVASLRESNDARAVRDWLEARGDVSGRIGAWGISYGGGQILNSLVTGVPWTAVEVAETWTNLDTALMPGGLAKSGVIGQLLGSIPPERRMPGLDALQRSAFAGTDRRDVLDFALSRSSLGRLGDVRTPVFLMQGRRDFVFGLDQAKEAYARLRGPKLLWIGNHGHAPSTFPGRDTDQMLRDGRRWFDRWLRGVPNGIEKLRVVLSRQGRKTSVLLPALPATRNHVATFPGKARVRTAAPLASAVETFGAPTVRVRATVAGGWARLVVVLTARTPAGKEIVVSAGGVPTRPGTRDYAIPLVDQATLVPRGSRLRLTFGSSSLAQNPGNLLYLELPQPPGARLALGGATLRLPVLRQVVSR